MLNIKSFTPSRLSLSSNFYITANRRNNKGFDDEDYDYFHRQEQSIKGNQLFTQVKNMIQNQKQLGAMLVLFGLLATFVGMFLFFQGNLLRLGNISTIAGVFLLLGPANVTNFFLRKSRMQATIITTLGVLLVLWGKPRFGLILEVFGLLNLFGNMFPMLFALGKNIPILKDVLALFDNVRFGNDDANTIGAESRRYNKYNNKPRKGIFPEF